MRMLQAYWEQIKQWLGGLRTAEKIAAGLLVVVLMMSIAWLIQWAAKPQTVAVFRTALRDQQLGRAQQVLRREKVRCAIKDGLIMVPADQRDQAHAALAFESIAPADSAMEFSQLIKEPSMWQTDKQAQRLAHRAKQAMLSRLIQQFPGVRAAHVVLEVGQKRGLGTPAVPATASVTLTLTNSGAMTRKLRTAAADLVAGSVAGMSRESVRIVDTTNQRSYRVPESSGYDDDKLEKVAALETRYENKIRDHLRYIPGVIVSVYAMPDSVKSVRTQETEYSDPVSGKITSSSEESRNTAAPAMGEPGISSNSQVRLPSTAHGLESSTEKARSNSDLRFPSKTTVTDARGEVLKEMSVSVEVPRDYLVKAHKSEFGDTEEPKAADIANRLEDIRKSVLGCVTAAADPADPAKADKLVTVRYFVPVADPVAAATAQAGVAVAMHGYLKPAALGGLAVTALLMVLMFARRRHPPQSVIEPVTIPGESSENLIATIDGEGALEGIELDEDAIRIQKVTEQVAEMVREKPDAASSLIQRWIHARK